MENEAFFAKSPKDRRYAAWLLSKLSPRWYFRRRLEGAPAWTWIVVIPALVIVYPLWLALILLAVGGYGMLWLLTAPLRLWAKKNKKGYWAEPPGGS